MLGKKDDIRKLISNLILRILLYKKTFQALVADIRADGFGATPVAGCLEGLLINIGGKNLEFRQVAPTLSALIKQHRDGIGFFAGSAAGHPNAQLIIAVLIFKQFGNNFGLQRFKSFGIAKKAGDADQQIFKKFLYFLRIILN